MFKAVYPLPINNSQVTITTFTIYIYHAIEKHIKIHCNERQHTKVKNEISQLRAMFMHMHIKIRTLQPRSVYIMFLYY